MISFSSIDIIILIVFFGLILLVGFIPGKFKSQNEEDYLLSGRKLGLVLFILTNVATWYGGILGVGEFTYRYGLLSWFTQGFPYYIFAILFAFLLAKKVRSASLYTIPDKIFQIYGKNPARFASVIVFIIVSPAPYFLMMATLLSAIFNLSIFASLVITVFLSVGYLLKGGYRSDVFTDSFQFFIMFIGFIVMVTVLFTDYYSPDLFNSLPEHHLSVTGGANPGYILVWFFIALWTFADPGFHQRTNAAIDGNIASKGIIISVGFWILFDFLTTTSGIFSRALLPDLDNPVMAFPLLAEKVLGSGLKGLFFAALFATILSTLNSHVFLSGTTFSKDLIQKFIGENNKFTTNDFTRIGIAISTLIGFVLALYLQSIIEMWYYIGSICIPGIIVLIFTSYYPKYKIRNNIALVESVAAVVLSAFWMILRNMFPGDNLFSEIEPMIIGLLVVTAIHFIELKIHPTGN